MTCEVYKSFKAFRADEALKTLGSFEATLKLGDYTKMESFYVPDKGEKNLLGADTINLYAKL